MMFISFMYRAPFLGMFLTGLLFIPSASAAPLEQGQLIKSTTPAVYYLGQNGKRYVFPTEHIFHSWYADFSLVKTISDAELASYPIGGNVTYRPGTRLVKITTDPKVYAVSHGGVLRWVKTETIAQTIFGPDWNKMIDDVPDAFFINYQSNGQPIEQASDYSINTEQQTSPTIDADRALIETSTPKTSPPPISNTSSTASTTIQVAPLLFSASTLELNPHERVELTATVSPQTDLDHLSIFFDQTLQATCKSSPCSVILTVPESTSESSFTAVAQAYWTNGEATSSLITIAPKTGTGSGMDLILARTELTPNQPREITVRTNGMFAAHNLEIFIDGVKMRGCVDRAECRLSDEELGPVGTVHRVFAVGTKFSGGQTQTPDQFITVVENDHPRVNILTESQNIFVGERTHIHITAEDDHGIDRIRLLLNGKEIGTCERSSCSITIGPWSQPQVLTIEARVTDTTGQTTIKLSNPISVRSL